MTHPPYPYPYPASQTVPSVGPTARYAGVMLLILGLLTLVMGGCTTVVGFNIDSVLAMPEVQKDPNFQKAMSDLRTEGIELKYVIVTLGILCLIYAIPALIVSILLITTRSRGPVVLGMVLIGLSLLPMILFLVLSLAGGNGIGAVFWGIVMTLHGLILVWLIQALRHSPTAYMHPPAYPGPYVPPPMQQYQYPLASDRTNPPAGNHKDL